MTIRELFFSLGYKEDKNSKKKVENGIKDLKGMATKMLGAIGVAFSISGLASVTGACLEAASAAEEMQNKFDVVFGECAKSAEEWASKYSDAIGRSKSVIKTYLADQQNLFTGFGMSRDAAMDMSEKITEAALDLASFNNIQDDEAVNAFSKAVMGESESAKRLGAVLNESTRALAMQELGLSGTYEKLDQLSKMQVNYRAIMDQSKDSIGDCVRSADSYEASVKRQNAAMKDMKELLGQFLMPAMAELRNGTTKVIKSFTGWLRKMKDSNDAGEKLVRVIKRGKEMVGTLADFVVRCAKSVNNIVQKIGGWEKVLRVLAIAAGIAIAALNFDKVVKGIKMVTSLLNPATLKLMAIAAVILLIAAIIDDFINFMQGNDSVIGTLLEKAGIDANKARDTIRNAFETIKTVATNVLTTIRQFLIDHQVQIGNVLGFIAKAIGVILAVIAVIKVVITVFTIVKGVIAAVGAVIAFLTSPIGIAIAIIAALIAVGVALYKNWDKIKAKASEIFQNIVSTIKEKIEAIKEFFVSLPAMAKQWMHDFVQGLINGIKEKIEGFVDTVKGIGEKIRSFLHFSVPDEGPLTDYERWMPDFISGMAKGIRDNIPLIESAVGKASEALGKMGNVSVNGKTALNASGNTSKTNNVQQHNEYNINVSGTDKQAVNNAANVISQSGNDNTGELARALCYG